MHDRHRRQVAFREVRESRLHRPEVDANRRRERIHDARDPAREVAREEQRPEDGRERRERCDHADRGDAVLLDFRDGVEARAIERRDGDAAVVDRVAEMRHRVHARTELRQIRARLVAFSLREERERLIREQVEGVQFRRRFGHVFREVGMVAAVDLERLQALVDLRARVVERRDVRSIAGRRPSA
jgi:hypothetical protein